MNLMVKMWKPRAGANIAWCGAPVRFFELLFFFKLSSTFQRYSRLGMGIVENSMVRFGSRFCFYGSVLSQFPKWFIKDISWIRNYAMECVAELA